MNDLFCQCGKTFRTMEAEARHRHNFPLMCRRPKVAIVDRYEPAGDQWRADIEAMPRDGTKVWALRKQHANLRMRVALVSWHGMPEYGPTAGHWRNHANNSSPVYDGLIDGWQPAKEKA